MKIEPRDILYEDQWLIAVFKPSGIPTQATVDKNRPHFYGLVLEYLKSRDSRGEVYLGLHHRLDRDTTGVVLMTKLREANLGVSSLFKKRDIVKEYDALVVRRSNFKVGYHFEVHNHLKEDGQKVVSVSSGGQVASTDFWVKKLDSEFATLTCKPTTGRRHQIRVHLAELDLPIVGDVLYGSRFSDQPLCLHARSLKFAHPMTGQLVEICAHRTFDIPK